MFIMVLKSLVLSLENYFIFWVGSSDIDYTQRFFYKKFNMGRLFLELYSRMILGELIELCGFGRGAQKM